MLRDYKRVTIHDVLVNKAGIIPFQLKEKERPEIVEKMWDSIPKQYPNPQRQRERITKIALNLKPLVKPGTIVIYSNVGYAILGSIAEIITGVQFENLIKDKIFNPLKMDSPVFGGWPASKEEPGQPRGHYFKEGEREQTVPQALDDEYVFPGWMNPSGGVNLNILDYAKYAKEHLLGLQGRGLLLEQTEYEIIHKIQAEAKLGEMYQIDDIATLKNMNPNTKITMGYGWSVIPVDSENTLSAMDGSGGTYFARIIVFPLIDAAFAGFSNCGNGNKALGFVIEKISGLKWDS
jgi:CubicO group peptidase (beta-lactamase class C family)